jgi:alkaline phosphatase
MATAALLVLSRDPDGFILLIEGGAIDWAAHQNNMNKMLGEALDFNAAVQVVIDWVDHPSNDSSWENTLVIVTADHETGYLTAAPGEFANQPLGEINATTLALEKLVSGSSYRASWQDEDNDSQIDPGESVYWAWNSTSHTNSLVPLFVKGVSASHFSSFPTGSDPVRGAYIDNTNVYTVMAAVIPQPAYRVYLPLTAR